MKEVFRQRYYKARQVAELLGVAHSTIHRWIREGHLPPPLQTGPKTFRWPKETIDALVEKAYQEAEKRNKAVEDVVETAR